MPVEIAGKATDRHPMSTAISTARRCAEASNSGSPAPPPRHTGPTAWITHRAGSAPAPVATASPVGQPSILRHSARISSPPARLIAPSTPPPPASAELAAFTMASTGSAVMSPCTNSSCIAKVYQAGPVESRTTSVGGNSTDAG